MPMLHDVLNMRAVLEREFEVYLKALSNDGMALVTGSMMEGLGLPRWCRVWKGHVLEITSPDIDVMMVRTVNLVGDREISPKVNLAYHIDTEGVHSGYLWLEIVRPKDVPVPYKSQVAGRSSYFLDSQACTEHLQNRSKFWPKNNIEEIWTLQGPALSLEFDFLTQSVSLPIPLMADAVLGLKVPVWPKMAQEWVTRRRTAGWPPQELVDDIVAHGCHVVATGYAKSVQRNLEWRFSFSHAELVLTGNLTKTQKQCYLLLKTLHLAEFKQPKGVVSYHLKTLLFWTCEQIPQRMWTEETVGQCVVSMLDRLLHCLVRRNLPSYFIPANNLIDTIPEDTLQLIARKVSLARRLPIQCLCSFNRNYKFCFGPLFVDIGDIFHPVLQDTNMEKTIQESIAEIYIPVALSLARAYLGDVRMGADDKQANEEHVRFVCKHIMAINQDISRMGMDHFQSHVHPAVIILPLLDQLQSASPQVAKVLCEVILDKFTDAPNRSDIEGRRSSLAELIFSQQGGAFK